MTEALIIRDDSRLTIRFTQSAIARRDQALADSALIGRVADAGEQKIAVGALAGIEQITREVEAARKEAKAPVIQFGREIDDTVKEYTSELIPEKMRLAGIIGDFQQLELARVRAAEAARRLEEDKLERERQDQIARAASLQEVDAVNEEFSRKQADLPPVIHQKAQGQVVREDWDITVTDVHALYRAHPPCCKLTPLLSEIRILLDAGVKVHGVEAKKIAKVGTRAGALKEIEIR